MEKLAALAIAEMPEAVKTAFLTADHETRVKLALAYAQDAADKQQKITNTLRSYPHKMEAFKAVVYDNVTQ